MEERPEAPSVVSIRLPASAVPRGVSAAHNRRLAAPNRTSRRAFPVTFEHDACAPLRSGAGVTQHLCGRRNAPCDALSHRPSRSIRFGDGRILPPCQRSGSLRRAGPHSYGLPCGSTRSESPMRSTDFCFPLLRLRALASRSLPNISPRLAPRPAAFGSHQDDGGWGTWRFKTPDPLRREAPGWQAVCSSACSRCHRTSDTPVARP